MGRTMWGRTNACGDRGLANRGRGGRPVKRTAVVVIAVIAALVLLAAAGGGLLVALVFAGSGGSGWVCSPVQGQLVDARGVPQAGVTVERSWHFLGERGSEQVRTDDEGRFSLDRVQAPGGVIRWLPAEQVVTQIYVAKLPTGDEEILQLTTRSLELGAETDGAPFDVVCRTGVEGGFDGLHWGTCALRR